MTRNRATAVVRTLAVGAALVSGVLVGVRPAQALSFTVTTVNDSGPGSLRAAIEAANANAGVDSITFGIGSGAKTITPTSALPVVTGPVVIDGTTQPNFTNAPLIRIDGAAAGASNDGLVLTASDSTIRGLAFTRWRAAALVLDTGDENTIVGNYIGTDGTGRLGGAIGLLVRAASAANVIGGETAAARNVISGNADHGVLITGDGTDNNVVSGNYIGTNPAGTASIANGVTGVKVADGPTGTLVGGTTTGARNVISGNDDTGVWVTNTSGTHVKGNWIGLNAAGTAPIRNYGAGIYFVDHVTASVVGGTEPGAGNVVSGNGLADQHYGVGVSIVGPGSSGNKILGNRVGTNPAGTAPIGNAHVGVYLGPAAAKNTVGGTTPAARNLISGNGDPSVPIGTGLGFDGASDNVALGNYIGTDLTGAKRLGNGYVGVDFANGSTRNVLGGTVVGSANVISSNGNHATHEGAGVGIVKNAAANKLLGNRIGTDVTGTKPLGNAHAGVFIGSGATKNIVGGAVAGARNLLSGNGVPGGPGAGLGIAEANSNTVLGNYIGTDASGTKALGNGYVGVHMGLGASSNVLGGTTAAAANVISGNGDFANHAGAGVHIVDVGTTGNNVTGNLIGTDYTGAKPVGNANAGVFIGHGAASNTIGGTAAAARNVISANGDIAAHEGVGISMFSLTGAPETTKNLVQGNYIGLTKAGTTALGNASGGVYLGPGADANTIGGAVTGAGNVISSNGSNTANQVKGGGDVILFGAKANLVAGNRIGTNSAGTAKLVNGVAGVFLGSGAMNNLIGGTVAAARNVISGHSSANVLIGDAGTKANRLQGNYIGTNSAGSAALGGPVGVQFYDGADDNVVGGSATGVRNVISGNDIGVAVTGVRPDNSVGKVARNVVSGNYIGTNYAGTAAVPNGRGIAVYRGAVDTLIGGTTPAARNVISGNTHAGISVSEAATTGTKIQGNYIGTTPAGTAARANKGPGVELYGGVSGVVVGGTTSGAGNVISGNASSGVSISGAGTTGNLVQGNRIGLTPSGAALKNTVSGVIVWGGATKNTIGGSVAGSGNHIANHTSYGGVDIDGATTVGVSVLGNRIFANGAGIRLLSNANANQPAPVLTSIGGSSIAGTAAPGSQRIEVFKNTNCTNAQGGQYLGAVTTTTGAWTLSGVVVPAGAGLTATATNTATGNTSTFSTCKAA